MSIKSQVKKTIKDWNTAVSDASGDLEGVELPASAKKLMSLMLIAFADNFGFDGETNVPDPLTLDKLTVTTLTVLDQLTEPTVDSIDTEETDGDNTPNRIGEPEIDR